MQYLRCSDWLALCFGVTNDQAFSCELSLCVKAARQPPKQASQFILQDEGVSMATMANA